jgi:hypothetical protein
LLRNNGNEEIRKLAGAWLCRGRMPTGTDLAPIATMSGNLTERARRVGLAAAGKSMSGSSCFPIAEIRP